MRKKQRAERIAAQLAELYPQTPVPLDHTDAFTLLIAVLLSAQTTDKKVNEVTPGLFAMADNPADMAASNPDAILDKIRQLGLAPTKAKRIHKLSHMLLDEHAGEVPADLEALERLPGVGHKTAQVVMAQAFGVPSFPVDTHIFRLAKRWKLSRGKNVNQVEKDLKAVFPTDQWNQLHLRIIFFGREHCPARRHDPQSCPICSWAA